MTNGKQVHAPQKAAPKSTADKAAKREQKWMGRKKNWTALDLLCVYSEMNNKHVYEMQCNLLPNIFDLLNC